MRHQVYAAYKCLMVRTWLTDHLCCPLLLSTKKYDMKKTIQTLIVALSSPVSSFILLPNVKRIGEVGRIGLAAENEFRTARTRRQTTSSPAPATTSKKGRTPQRGANRVANNAKQAVSSRSEKRKNSKRVDLLEPSVIFSNNHLLVVNKPAGYHSQPNESADQRVLSKKCLLSKLKKDELGGGSAKKFLLPMHRLDQPCTGILLLAKTSKAGTRTGNAFRKHAVKKDYFCVVEGNLKDMMQRSDIVSKENSNRIYKLSGVLKSNKSKSGVKPSKGGASVLFKPLQQINDMGNLGDQRVCHLEWEHLLTVSKNIHLVRVVTETGAKHQVRAMLSQLAKSPVCGDLRYGASAALPDMSVALHARSLHLPTVSLGDMNMKDMRFIAPIPKTWTQFFSLKESSLPTIHYT